ncbi:MAG TPA: YdcH family protein [Rhizomicrobium sp.]|jgi:hypothetical protein|nr:YdcH family protein [Rhizomicrobium sp.]
MHSAAQTNSNDNPGALGALAPPYRSDPAQLRHIGLAQEHRDLDDIIAVLSRAGAPDEALITRLKKKKLQVRDEMVRLEAALAA